MHALHNLYDVSGVLGISKGKEVNNKLFGVGRWRNSYLEDRHLWICK